MTDAHLSTHPNPRPGDFALVRSSGWAAHVIRLWTRSHYNHAVVFTGAQLVVEAQPKGAVLSRWHRDPSTYVVSSGMITLSQEQRVTIIQAALSCVGTPYGWLDIISIGLLQYGIRPSWIRNRVEKSSSLICSQLVDRCYKMAGVHLFEDGREPMDVTPGDLAKRIGYQ